MSDSAGPRLGLAMGADCSGEGVYKGPLEALGARVTVFSCAHGPVPAQALKDLDGLVLSGGGDVHPSHYGQEHGGLSRGIDMQRDTFEMALVHGALEAGIPLLGICRGCQVLNVALGGTLYQDLRAEHTGRTLEHSYADHDPGRFHGLRLDPGSWLARAAGRCRITVNSHHHQGVREPGPGVRIVAWAIDGVGEAIELASSVGLAIGVQWHPERLTPDEQWPLRSFVRACARGRTETGPVRSEGA
ncbi:MAG TPA: gamma-glutamyl-gamma-aminobutyrate hydrolase family protein [Armatimonadota bacterium]|nr:gamma-glutamyl-gamma-aminobutyrate hydrolase family protein [Armatimonadota bacterium]